MSFLTSMFKTEKPVIGMLHLRPLPGDPLYYPGGSVSQVVEAAKRDLEALQQGGVDGILITNELSMPYEQHVSPSTLASMGYVIGALSHDLSTPWGAEAIYDGDATIELCAAVDAQFTRCNFCGAWAGDLGLINRDFAHTMRRKAALRLDDLDSVRATHLTVVSLSDFNDTRALQGQEPVTLEAGTCALANNMEIVEPLARAVLEAVPTVTIAGTDYALAGPLYDTQLEDNAMAATAMVIVAPDEAVEALKEAGCIPDMQYLNVMYADNGKTASENDAALGDIVAALQPRDMGGFEKGTQGADDPYASLLWPVTRILTANEMLSQSAGLRLMITYLALYIGFVFLISTAAILAIQQLSQASDSTPRYRILWKLGCDRGMIYRSLLAQVLVYFLVPLGLAVCHSVCAIGVLSDSLLDAIGVSSAGPIMMAAGLTLVIYGGYMLVTYLAARGIVKGSLQQG